LRENLGGETAKSLLDARANCPLIRANKVARLIRQAIGAADK